jgi:uncharacterized protein YndB with AHSA1/START domain
MTVPISSVSQTPLTHSLDRTVTIEATPETVFRFFTDNGRWASWWGAGSTIEPRPGGAMKIRYPNGVEVSGDVIEMTEAERIVFTYGFVSGNPIGPGESQVTITLRPVPGGTELHLRHAFAEAQARDEHVQGWRFQLSLFGNAVLNEVHANAAETVDAWYAVWSMTDAAARDALIAKIAAPGVEFRDRYSLLKGAEDLSAHITAAMRFMPGLTLKRKGNIRRCQSTALSDWTVTATDGSERMSGSSVFHLGCDSRIVSAVGIES